MVSNNIAKAVHAAGYNVTYGGSKSAGRRQRIATVISYEREVISMADTIYKDEEKPEIDCFVELIKQMDEETQNNMLIFLQGVQFVEHVHKEAAACVQ